MKLIFGCRDYLPLEVAIPILERNFDELTYSKRSCKHSAGINGEGLRIGPDERHTFNHFGSAPNSI
jgi:hypothetical protein